jgi:secreted PhoX family phosphatase
VVEDGGDMRAMVFLPDGTTIPLLRLPGDPAVTEVTGPTFSPDGTRIYVASQRALLQGAPAAFRTGGVIYEITMPFAVRVSYPLAGRVTQAV